MATYTPNLNLKKPDYSDTADIEDINSNMDKLDTAITEKDPFDKGTLIPDGSDFNDYLTLGRYYVINATSVATMSHTPTTVSGGSLEVFYAGSAKAQRYVANYSPNRTWERAYLNNAWTEWKESPVYQMSLGTFSTEAGLAALLDAKLATMDTNEISGIIVQATANAGVFTENYYYMGTLHKRGSITTFSHAMLYGSGLLAAISCSRSTDGWLFRDTATDVSMYGAIEDNTDLNSLTGPYKTGFLSMIRTYGHNPAPGVSAIVTTISASYASSSYFLQIVTTANDMYIRRKFTNSGSEWGSWKHIDSAPSTPSAVTRNTTNTSAASISQWRNGETFTISGSVTPSVSGATGWKNVANTSYTPPATVYFSTDRPASPTNARGCCLGRITTTGTIDLYSPSDTIQYFHATFAKKLE